MTSDAAFCQRMLPLVSRTFAACIGLLPRRLSYEVLIAYLLCRIADTIEDAPELSNGEKHRLLHDFAQRLDAGTLDEIAQTFAQLEHIGPDQELVIHGDRVLREYRNLRPASQAAIAPWVVEMCHGMADFSCDARLQPSTSGMQALMDLSDLDRYCYFVAGTVGHLLTELFAIHHPRLTRRHYSRMKSLATSFGLGLQLTNIIKDVADDSQRGWSFVPRRLCEELGTSPETLLDPAHEQAAKAVMAQLIAKAQAHLDDALAYCQAIPRSAYRIRLFCLTPLYFAVRTLTRARHDPRLLDPQHKVKISRTEVYRTLRTSALVAPTNTMVSGYYRRLLAQRGAVALTAPTDSH